MRLLRGVSGLLAGGLVALFLALVVAVVVAGRMGAPGPGMGMLVWHAVAAVVAVVAQRYADRHAGGRSAAAALAVIAVAVTAVSVLWVLTA